VRVVLALLLALVAVGASAGQPPSPLWWGIEDFWYEGRLNGNPDKPLTKALMSGGEKGVLKTAPRGLPGKKTVFIIVSSTCNNPEHCITELALMRVVKIPEGGNTFAVIRNYIHISNRAQAIAWAKQKVLELASEYHQYHDPSA
jgi:hypothetical protein